MPEHAILPRQLTGDIAPQGSPGSPEQLTDDQLRAIARVTVTTIVAMRDLYGEVEALMVQGNRSDQHQKWLLSRTAHALHTYEIAAEGIQRRAIGEIIANRPPEVVTRIIEVPQKGVLPRLFGR
jgi:hypothetical protein